MRPAEFELVKTIEENGITIAKSEWGAKEKLVQIHTNLEWIAVEVKTSEDKEKLIEFLEETYFSKVEQYYLRTSQNWLIKASMPKDKKEKLIETH